MWLTDRRAIPVLICASLIVMAAFSLWPSLDLSVTQAFYAKPGFPIEARPGIETLRLALWNASTAMALLSLTLGILTAVFRRSIMGLGAQLWGFIFVMFLLGPGLLVNGLLKEFWGRARPRNTVNFGGTAQFTPPYQITDQCASNCSFVSGEAAGSTALAIALLLILAMNRARLPNWGFRLGQGITIAVPLFIFWQRVAVGRHFLSDVLMAGLFVALIAAVLARAMRLQVPAVAVQG